MVYPKELFLIFVSWIWLYQTKVAAQEIVTENRRDNDSIFVDFINPYQAPIAFSLEVNKSVTWKIGYSSSFVILPSQRKNNVLRIPIHMNEDTLHFNLKENLTYKAHFGDPENIVPDYDYEYLLPYPAKTSYKIIQSFDGTFSHNLPHSKFAIDFGLEVGDTITAARPGKVIFVKQDSREYGKDGSFINKANKVIVMHADGTFAHYVHLSYNGASVAEGDVVQTGDVIGVVGMSGFTTIPHLHFVVLKERGISIPIKFKGIKRQKLKTNKYYKQKEID